MYWLLLKFNFNLIISVQDLQTVTNLQKQKCKRVVKRIWVLSYSVIISWRRPIRDKIHLIYIFTCYVWYLLLEFLKPWWLCCTSFLASKHLYQLVLLQQNSIYGCTQTWQVYCLDFLWLKCSINTSKITSEQHSVP